MRLLLVLAILGLLAASAALPAGAAAPSDWPSLAGNAGQSNVNPSERALSVSNVLKLKVKWTAPVPDISYPIVAGGRVYAPVQKGKTVQVQVLDALTGKEITTYTESAIGGILVSGGKMYLAGHTLHVLDPANGDVLGTIKGVSPSSQATFADPVADSRVILAGYASASPTISNSIYAIDPSTNSVLWHSPSQNAQSAIVAGRVLTLTSTGTVSYGELSGKVVTTEPSLLSDWFSGGALAYTVATASNHNATLFAYDTSGRNTWSRTVGPRLDPRGWAHAANAGSVYVAMFKPYEGLEALDPSDGSVRWRVKLAGIQHLAVAHGIVFAISNQLSMPLRLVMYRAGNGKVIGSLSLSSGYFAFPTKNELMIADGMVFVRAVGPGGPTLVALGI
jgi:hypothetical protein